MSKIRRLTSIKLFFAFSRIVESWPSNARGERKTTGHENRTGLLKEARLTSSKSDPKSCPSFRPSLQAKRANLQKMMNFPHVIFKEFAFYQMQPLQLDERAPSTAPVPHQDFLSARIFFNLRSRMINRSRSLSPFNASKSQLRS